MYACIYIYIFIYLFRCLFIFIHVEYIIILYLQPLVACDPRLQVMMVGDNRKYNIALVTLLCEGATGELPGNNNLAGVALEVPWDAMGPWPEGGNGKGLADDFCWEMNRLFCGSGREWHARF